MHSATGQALPPIAMIIWKKKTMAPDMATGEIPGTLYGATRTQRGMKSKTFVGMLKIIISQNIM